LGTKANKQAKAPSFTLPRPRNTLLDDAATQVGIDQAAHRPFDSSNQAGIRDTVLACELRKRLGFENTHQHPTLL
jgi:hypothetical protein